MKSLLNPTVKAGFASPSATSVGTPFLTTSAPERGRRGAGLDLVSAERAEAEGGEARRECGHRDVVHDRLVAGEVFPRDPGELADRDRRRCDLQLETLVRDLTAVDPLLVVAQRGERLGLQQEVR